MLPEAEVRKGYLWGRSAFLTAFLSSCLLSPFLLHGARVVWGLGNFISPFLVSSQKSMVFMGTEGKPYCLHWYSVSALVNPEELGKQKCEEFTHCPILCLSPCSPLHACPCLFVLMLSPLGGRYSDKHTRQSLCLAVLIEHLIVYKCWFGCWRYNNC